MKKTLKSVIMEVFKENSRALTPKEILTLISEKNLYNFKSKNPLNIITNELRRHCHGNIQSKNRVVLYEKLDNQSYQMISTQPS